MSDPDDPNDPRAARLRSLRERAGLSRAQLALRAGVSPETVRNAEVGHCRPSARVARAMAEALGVKVQDLEPKPGPITLKELRRATGLTQRAMSEVLGMSASMVSAVEAGLYGVRDPARWAVGYQVGPKEWTAAWEAGRDVKRRAAPRRRG